MGIAAYYRGNEVISRHFADERALQLGRESFRLAVEREVACDEWRRVAMSWYADALHGDVAGFAGRAVRETAESTCRVHRARHAKVIAAHGAWLDVHPHDQGARTVAARDYAVAVWRMLDWARGCWRLALLDDAPALVRNFAR